jgi:hypothetical protein
MTAHDPRMDGSGDPFLAKFFARIPADVASSFTPAQLDAVKMAFGARSWGSHAIDIRKSFGLPLVWRRFYLVLLMGAERREEDRLRAEGALFGTLGNAALTIAFLAVLLIPSAFVLYALKSFAGIDVLPGSEGLHGFWDDLARQLELLFK